MSTKPHFESVTPRLPVLDVQKALAFYIEQLGFELSWKWGEPISHASVCRDAIGLDLIAASETRRGTAMAYVQVSGVDAYHAELKSRNLAVTEPQDRPYGMRDFEILDPDGNGLAFGEPVE